MFTSVKRTFQSAFEKSTRSTDRIHRSGRRFLNVALNQSRKKSRRITEELPESLSVESFIQQPPSEPSDDSVSIDCREVDELKEEELKIEIEEQANLAIANGFLNVKSRSPSLSGLTTPTSSLESGELRTPKTEDLDAVLRELASVNQNYLDEFLTHPRPDSATLPAPFFPDQHPWNSNPIPESAPFEGDSQYDPEAQLISPIYQPIVGKNRFVTFDLDWPQTPVRAHAAYIYGNYDDFLLARNRSEYQTEIGWAQESFFYLRRQIEWLERERIRLLDDYRQQREFALNSSDDEETFHGFRFPIHFVESQIEYAKKLRQAQEEVLSRDAHANYLEQEGNLSARTLEVAVANEYYHLSYSALPLVFDVVN